MTKPLRNRVRRSPTSLRVASGLGMDVPELQRARTLWTLNRFDESLQLFDQAVRKYPQNLLALTDAARAFGVRFEIARAEELLDRLMALGARNATVLQMAGQSYRMIFRPEKATECFERALVLSRNLPDVHLELAVSNERRHLLGEALASVEECLRRAPDYKEARLFQGRLFRRLNRTSESESVFRALTSDEQAHPLVRAQAWTEIAQELDRQGQYDEAMQAMRRGKEFLLPRAEPFRRESEVVQGILRTLTENVTLAHFQRWAEAAGTLPPRKVALLTSFPRSGTTLLEQALDSHPGLVSSDEREAFARDIFPAMWMTPSTLAPTVEALDVIPLERLSGQRQRYLAYMAAALNEPIGERVHLDKNPPFTLLIPALFRLFPEIKLLIALRDPRDVVLSCFMQYLPLNTNSVCYLSLESAAERYAHDLGVWRRLREIFPPQWLEVRYEDTVVSFESETRRALEFLGLPWDTQVLCYRERLQSKAVSSPTYEAVRKPLYTTSIGRWRHYEKYLAALAERLRPFIEAFGYG